MKSIVSYVRVSTSQQGRSGLGIEAQRDALARFAVSEDLEIAAEASVGSHRTVQAV